MKLRTAISLLILALLAGAVVVALQSGWLDGSLRTADDDTGPLFADAPPFDELVQIDVVLPDGSGASFRRDRQRWRIVSPSTGPADPYSLRQLADAALRLTVVERYAPGDEDRPGEAVTGLESPRGQVRTTDRDGQTRTIVIGRSRPMSPQTYVLRNEDPAVFLVDRDPGDWLQPRLDDYRDHNVIQFEPDQVTRIAAQGRFQWTLRRDGDRWRLTDPTDAPADARAVAELMRGLRNLRAERFIREVDSPAPFGRGGPGATFALDLAGDDDQPPRTLRIDLAQAGGEAFGRVDASDWTFQTRRDALETLPAALETLRSRRAMHFDPGQVRGIRITAPAGEVALVRDDAGPWRLTAPSPAPAEGEAVTQLLAGLGALTAQEITEQYTTLAAFGLDAPARTITLELADGAGQTLLLGGQSPTGQVTFAARAGAENPPVLALPTPAVDALNISAEALRSRVLIDIDPARVQAIRIDRPDGPALRIGRSDPPPTFRLVEPIEDAAETSAVEALLSALSPLRAEAIVHVGPELPERFAEADPVVSVTLDLAQAEPTSQPTTAPAAMPDRPVLRIASLDGQVYAWRSDAGPLAVGRCSPALLEAVSAEMRSRAVLDIEPDRVVQLRLVTDERTLTFNRTDAGWALAEDEYVRVSPAAVNQVLNLLSPLRCRRWDDYRSPELSPPIDGQIVVTVRYDADNPPEPGRVAHYLVIEPNGSTPQLRRAHRPDVQGTFELDAVVVEQFAQPAGAFTAE